MKRNSHQESVNPIRILASFLFFFLKPEKYFKREYVLGIIGTLFNSFLALSQNSQMTFKYLTVDNGLSENCINAIYRDNKDYLWIGTCYSGLNKYDGNRIIIYENIENQPGEISNNCINCIYEDSWNNLWIGTRDGLNLYNPKTDDFTVFRHNKNDTNNGNFVTSVLEDKKGNLWATYITGAGLTRWDHENKKYDRFFIKTRKDSFHVNSINSIMEDSKGNLWVVSNGPGIYRFEPKTGNFIAFNDPDMDFGQNLDKVLYIDKNDKIWIGTFGKGLFSFEPSTVKFKNIGDNINGKGMSSNLVTYIKPMINSHLIIATDQGGINLYDMVTNSFEYIVQDVRIKNGLNSNGILSLYPDKEGIQWVGTSRGGVNYFNPLEQKFKLYELDYSPNSQSNIIGCFYEDSEGLIWIGTDGGGVYLYNPGTGKFKAYKHNPTDPNSISGNVIRSISEDADHDIWIGTWDAGLNRFDKRTKRFYRYLPDKKDTTSISSETIWHLIVDHKNNIWLSSYQKGVEIFDKKKGVVKRFFPNPDDPRSLSHNVAWFIYEDFQKNIWICTEDGICLYDSITSSFTVYNNFPDNNIVAFCRDSEGKLWAGGRSNGLFIFRQDGTIVKVYNKRNGLPDNTINAIVEDHNRNLWISTNKGISFFNQEKQEFRNYNIKDGLQGNAFFEQSFLKLKNNEILFGGYNGFNAFHPDSIPFNSNAPKVYITGFKLLNKPVPFGTQGSPLKYPVSETKEIKLSWRESVISFEFIAVSYTEQEKNEYAYMMEGFDKEWHYVGRKRDATYTNLEPGEYIFKVKASNNDGIWNKEGASIRIIITPPFWETLLFKVMAVILILLIIGLFIRLRVLRLKQLNLLLEKKVKERTLELQKANTYLKEQQEEIKSQQEELLIKKVSLEEANETLRTTQQEIITQNKELDIYRNKLESLVEARTSELLEALKKSEESDRLKSSFLANMSHEIRTPMNAIMGYSALLKDENYNESEKHNYLNAILGNSKSLLVLINDILDLSRIQSNQLSFSIQPENVMLILNEIYHTFNIEVLKKDIQLKLNTKKIKNDQVIVTDKIRFKQVISNLLSNAIKFTQKGIVEFGIHDISHQIVIYVKDTGIGIPDKAGESIFERFLKLEEDKNYLYRGAGLGLAICKSLVSLWNGTIWYKSKENVGTTFYFSHPLGEDKPVLKPERKKERPFKLELKGKTILIAEDEESNYNLLLAYLDKTGAIVLWAKNGKQTCEMVDSNNIDLILMDIKMPFMNGIEASKIIKQKYPGIPIIAQTAYTSSFQKDLKLENVFDSFISKPIDFRELFIKIAKFVK